MSEPLNYCLDRVRKPPMSTGKVKFQPGIQGKAELKADSANQALKQHKSTQGKNETSINFETMINEFLSSRYKKSELQELLIISRLKKALSKNIRRHDASKISYRIWGQELMDIVKHEFGEIVRKIHEVARENRLIEEPAGKNVDDCQKVWNIEAILQKFSCKSCILHEEELENIIDSEKGLKEKELRRVADGRERDFAIGLCKKIINLRNNRAAIEKSLVDKLNIRKLYKTEVMEKIERLIIKNKEDSIENQYSEEISKEISIDNFEGSLQGEAELNEEAKNPSEEHQKETNKIIEFDQLKVNNEIKGSICEDRADLSNEIIQRSIFEDRADLSNERNDSICEDRADLSNERKGSICEDRADLSNERKGSICEDRADLSNERINRSIFEDRADLCNERNDSICEDRAVLSNERNDSICKDRADFNREIIDGSIFEDRADLSNERKDSICEDRGDFNKEIKETIFEDRKDAESEVGEPDIFEESSESSERSENNMPIKS